ncbi:MAG: hypothetical protein J5496_03425 [Lachnospiraceae bacterium]|nr:hypothetical protein [Lachnospiraceae bacterium]
MLGLLVKKQLTEIFRGYFYDAKKNKARSKAATIVLIALFAVLMFGLLGGMFYALAGALAYPLAAYDLGWLYFALMSLIAIVLGLLGSVFTTYAGLYLAKDNDLLLSMPIPVRTIVTARIVGVYLMGLLFSGIVMVPALIAYWKALKPGAAEIIGGIVLLLLVSAIVLALSCLLGYGVARISVKLKNKSYITTVIALVFIGVYYYFYFKAQEKLQEFMSHLDEYTGKLSGSLGFMKTFGEVGEGKAIPVLVSVAVVALLCAVVWLILIRSFTKIATAVDGGTKTVYREKTAKERSLSRTLIAKEMGRFTSSANYMLNCGLFSVLSILAAAALLWKGPEFMPVLQMVFGQMPGAVLVLLTGSICALAGMNDMVVPSVSLEGKSLWIVKSLPVTAWDVLKAKLSVQLRLTLVPTLLCAVCAVIIYKPGAAELILMLLLPVLTVLFGALFGLMLGIRHVNLTWTNELMPIKQSLSVLIYLFAMMAYGAALIGLYFLIGQEIGALWYLTIAGCVIALIDVLLWQWLKTRGVKRFAEL